MANTFRVKLVRLADELAQEIYRLTLEFPKREMYALGDQLRRSILSVPANIIEGYARSTEKEKKRFFDIAYASLAEAKYLLYFSFKQEYVSKKIYLRLKGKCEEVSKLLWSLLSKIKADQLTS